MDLSLLLKVIALVLFGVATYLRKDLVAAGLGCWVAAEIF